MNKKNEIILPEKPINLKIHSDSSEKAQAISLQAEIRARGQKGCCPQTFYDNTFNALMGLNLPEQIDVWIRQFRHYNSLGNKRTQKEWFDARLSRFIKMREELFKSA